MTDHEVAQPEEEDEGDRGLPLFWGILFVALITVIAVWLFSQLDLGGESVDATSTAVEGFAQNHRIELNILGA